MATRSDAEISVSIRLDDGSIKTGFLKFEKTAARSAMKASQGFQQGFSSRIFNTIGNRIKSITSDIARFVTVAAGGFLVFKGVREGVDNLLSFEQAFKEIRTILPDVTKGNKQLSDQLINLSAQFGTSAQEQAKSFYQIISAGITDTASATDALVAANKLAVGGLASTTESIDILTGIIKGYGEETINATEAADILFTTVRLGKTTISQLASSLGLVVPTASALGVSFSDVTAAVAALTTKSITTSIAVTQLNAIFTAVLKKQAEAKKILGDSADAFSLQALQTKGLTNFLKDLFNALGGSEEKLTKLLGRVEGSKAILALANDGFKTLADNVKALEGSAGAADRAYREINESLGRQLSIFGSNISSIVLKFTSQASGGIANFLQDVNDGLFAIVLNFDTFITEVEIRLKALAITIGSLFLAIKIGPIFTSLLTQITILGARVKLLGVSFLGLRAAGLSTFASLTGAIKIATIGMRVFTTAVRVAQAVMTFGLAIIINELLTQFMLMKDASGDAKSAFQGLFITMKLGFEGVKQLLLETIIDLGILPQKLETSLLIALNRSIENVRVLKKEFDELGVSGENAGTKTEGMSARIAAIMKELQEKMGEAAKEVNDKTKQIETAVNSGLVNGISRGMQAVGAALASGVGGFEDFRKAILGIIGDMLINIGTAIIATSEAVEALKATLTTLFGGFGFAAGLALIALGGALKAASGITSAATAGPGGAGNVAPPEFIAPPDESLTQAEPKTVVNLTVQGDIMDNRDTGLRLIEILQETFDTTNAEVVTA